MQQRGIVVHNIFSRCAPLNCIFSVNRAPVHCPMRCARRRRQAGCGCQAVLRLARYERERRPLPQADEGCTAALAAALRWLLLYGLRR